MSENPDSKTEVLESDARQWLRQIVSGAATTADAEALTRWRRQSEAHEAAFIDAVRLWKRLGPTGSAFVEKRGAPTWTGPRMAITTRRAILGGSGALAASAVGYAIVKPPLNLWPSLDELRADYRTGTGEQKRVSVADVTVQMNTQTSIAFPSPDGNDHAIRLIAGEASFATPEQSSRRLIVLAGDGRTVASRARFDIRTIAGKTCVTCLEGELMVELGARSAPLGAGWQLTYDETGLFPAVTVDPREVTSWHDGFIVFRATPLSAAVAEINRYRLGKVVVLNATLGQKAISGRFRVERVDEILGWIERATGARSRALPGGIVLLS
jgi:transmembrane sensor